MPYDPYQMFPPGPPGQPPGPGPGAQFPPGPPPTTGARPLRQFTLQPGVFAVDPGTLYPCLYRYVFVTLNNGRSFWFWPVFVGRNSTAGYRWTLRRGWVYFAIDLNRIASFTCY